MWVGPGQIYKPYMSTQSMSAHHQQKSTLHIVHALIDAADCTYLILVCSDNHAICAVINAKCAVTKYKMCSDKI